MKIVLALIASILLINSSAFASAGGAASAVNEDSLDKAQTQVQGEDQKENQKEAVPE